MSPGLLRRVMLLAYGLVVWAVVALLVLTLLYAFGEHERGRGAGG